MKGKDTRSHFKGANSPGLCPTHQKGQYRNTAGPVDFSVRCGPAAVEEPIWATVEQIEALKFRLEETGAESLSLHQNLEGQKKSCHDTLPAK